MRTFKLHRKIDDSGVSGTGIVAEGVQITDGRCILAWLGDVHSINIYGSPEEIVKIHGHQGHTSIVWDDQEKA